MKKKKTRKKKLYSLHLSNMNTSDIETLQCECMDYLDCGKRLEDTEVVIQDLMTCKLLTLSVYEALRTTIIEIKQVQESLGVQISRTGSRRPTDVMDRTPQTIEESVTNAMEQDGVPLKLLYLGYWDKVYGLCEELHVYKNNNSDCTMCQKQTESSQKPIFSDSIELPKAQRRENILEVIAGTISRNKILSSQTTDKSDEQCLCVQAVSADWLQMLRIHTIEHLDNAVTIICEQIAKSVTTKFRSRRTCWLAYEGYIYGRLMKPLLQLYVCMYYPVVETLRDGVPLLTAKDLELQGGLLVMYDVICASRNVSTGKKAGLMERKGCGHQGTYPEYLKLQEWFNFDYIK